MANHPCILGYGTLEEQGFRVFKKRMVYYASFDNGYFNHRTKEYKRPLHWFELAKEKWTRVYKTTGTPCSRMLCQGEKYDRLEYKRETRRLVHEEKNYHLR